MIFRSVTAALALLLAGCAAQAQSHFRGTAITEAAPDFTLTSDSGAPWTLSQQHGKVVALFFGYSECDDECPDTIAKLAKSFALAGGTAADSEVAFVTVDPQDDTPAVLHRYLRRFSGARIIGLTGTSAQIAQVESLYHVYAQRVADPRSKDKFDETHSLFSFLIDRTGYERVLHDDKDPQAEFVADMRTLLT
jgi:protein SCO1